MADPALHLGLYMRLDVEQDAAAGKPEPLLRDRLIEALRVLRRLPSDIDAAGIQRVAKEVVAGHSRVVAQVQGSVVPTGDVVSMDLGAVAIALLGRAWSPEGYLLCGYRWRLVSRGLLDDASFDAEVRQADLCLAQWLRAGQEQGR